MKTKIKVRSLEALGTLQQDLDIGIIRVPGYLFRHGLKRNAFVRISVFNKEGGKKSLVRIVRAGTGIRALKKNEVALQYDDRIELGIKKAGDFHEIQIVSVSSWRSILPFLLKHPSPLVRMESLFAATLMAFGALIGFVLGIVGSEVFL